MKQRKVVLYLLLVFCGKAPICAVPEVREKKDKRGRIEYAACGIVAAGTAVFCAKKLIMEGIFARERAEQLGTAAVTIGNPAIVQQSSDISYGLKRNIIISSLLCGGLGIAAVYFLVKALNLKELISSKPAGKAKSA
jgi:hypothetical protein